MLSHITYTCTWKKAVYITYKLGVECDQAIPLRVACVSDAKRLAAVYVCGCNNNNNKGYYSDEQQRQLTDVQRASKRSGTRVERAVGV